VFILYPRGRVSPLQERQMTCTGSPNIFPISIEGSFDDAQNIVKDLFNDLAFKEQNRLSAVNSINIVRILAQCVYYLHAWNRLPSSKRDHLTFVVPTGNFGNIFAGWLAARMGLPAEGFTIATNQNDILYRLFTSGQYQPGDVDPSLAPSMDIQVASNFERFLFYLLERDGARVTELMNTMKARGSLEIPGFDPSIFNATRADDSSIREIIARVYETWNYVVDPHTACGFAGRDPVSENGHRIILSTAHPAKFAETIEATLGIIPTHPTLEALKTRAPVSFELAPETEAVRAFIAENAA
ncbi:MAG: threonine synthase, partial [Verrucomicrobiales bacterium]